MEGHLRAKAAKFIRSEEAKKWYGDGAEALAKSTSTAGTAPTARALVALAAAEALHINIFKWEDPVQRWQLFKIAAPADIKKAPAKVRSVFLSLKAGKYRWLQPSTANSLDAVADALTAAKPAAA